jgi:anti-sigma B factor antagonist
MFESGTGFEIHESVREDGFCLTVAGEVDLATAPALRERLRELRAEERPVRVDLSQVEFMDSSGLAVLVAATNEARANGWRFAVDPDVAPQVRRLFQIAGVEAFILGHDVANS